MWEKWEKLTTANDYHINITYGTEEKAKLISGNLTKESYNKIIFNYNLIGSLLNNIKNEMINKIANSSPNEINIYSSVNIIIFYRKSLGFYF